MASDRGQRGVWLWCWTLLDIQCSHSPSPVPCLSFYTIRTSFSALLSKVWIVRSSECHVSRVTCHASPSIPDNCGNVGDMRKCLIHVHNQSENNRQCPTITILCRGEVWWLLSYSSTRTNIYFLTWKFKLSRDQVIQFGKTDGTEYYSVIIDHSHIVNINGLLGIIKVSLIWDYQNLSTALTWNFNWNFSHQY